MPNNFVTKGIRLPWQAVEVLDGLLKEKGISFSEYTRTLILEDLDKRGVFTDALKKQLEEKGKMSQ